MPRSKAAEIPAAKPTAPRTTGTRRVQKLPQGENDIFALDIGTRNVVGIIGHMEDGTFVVTDAYSVPHSHRDMLDGQIEDINETARIVRQVKETLENKSGMALTRVAIAAAGRALRTKRTFIEHDVESKEKITEDTLRSLELEAVAKAQNELDRDDDNMAGTSFYCVGHTVIKYKLDDYPIKSLVGHKGKKASVELIAAFLPSLVVESLYAVMDLNSLDVQSLTLEPIAAMNVIIPPEVRLINIALVDIGAGTTDIAISQNGSIVAYAMATTAGDEITEEIIQKYLVDFETAERMKLTMPGDDVTYTDILGFEHNLSSEEFFEGLFPAIDMLADTISKNILEANGGAPSAVFLVGGGSLIPDLAAIVAEKLGVPENRVAIGGQSYQKNVNLGKHKINGPEFVTPIGIGITATTQTGYDFSVVTLNGNKIRIFDTKAVTAADLLMNAGFKTNQIIGRSGRGLTFTLNGEKQTLRGETALPASISVNGLPAALEHTIKQGDVIEFTPATIGMNAAVTISDIAGDVYTKKVTIDGEEYTFGRTARANDTVVSGSYSVQNYDSVTIETIETLGDLILSLPFDCSQLSFYKSDRLVRMDYLLCENDAFVTKVASDAHKEHIRNRAREIAEMDEKANRTVDLFSNTPMKENAETAVEQMTLSIEPENESFYVYLNDRKTVLAPKSDNSPHEFLELMALADIDISNPPASGNMTLTINGKNAGFMDPLKIGDRVIIRWEE